MLELTYVGKRGFWSNTLNGISACESSFYLASDDPCRLPDTIRTIGVATKAIPHELNLMLNVPVLSIGLLIDSDVIFVVCYQSI